MCHCSQRLIKEACEVIRKRLENDETLKKRTNLNVDNFTELLTFVLWTTYLIFGGVLGGFGAKHHRHSTRGLPTEKLEEICG